MPRRDIDPLFDSVVKNAVDFLKQSVADLQRRPKYSVIHFCGAVELFLKARLMREHWTLIVSKPESANRARLQKGDFRSVTMDDAIQRLSDVAGQHLSGEATRSFRAVRDHRNKLIHFFHEQYVRHPDPNTISSIVAEQCRSWFELHRLLIGPWATEFRRYRRVIEALNRKMHAHRPFLHAKYNALRPEIEAASKRGVVYEECESCGFSASEVDDQEPLVLCRCRVCGAQQEYLRVECPSCDEKVVVDDPSLEEDCPHCGAAIEVSALVERYGPVEDPKEDSVLAFCSECERTDIETVIPYGDDGEYLCLNCTMRHDSAANCGWCSTRVTGLNYVDSSVFGCILCGGSVSSDHS